MNWQNIFAWFTDSLGLVAFCTAQIAALIMIPLGLPGLWVQAAAACVLTMSSNHLGWWWTAAVVILAAMGEALDWLLGALGLETVGASKLAAWGSLLCGFIFAFFGALIPTPIPLLGAMVMSFVGTLVGAVLGEMAHERKLNPKLRVALGAVLGRACGVASKLSLSFIASGVVFIALMLELAAVLVKSK